MGTQIGGWSAQTWRQDSKIENENDIKSHIDKIRAGWINLNSRFRNLFAKIIKLPKKARSSRGSGNQISKLITYFRKGNFDKKVKFTYYSEQ